MLKDVYDQINHIVESVSYHAAIYILYLLLKEYNYYFCYCAIPLTMPT